MILDDGFAASFKDGKWVAKALFNGYELDQAFGRVEDPAEAEAILSEMHKALKIRQTA